MKLQNGLSFKGALLFALPCLAAVLLFTACSSDDSTTTSETVRFSASTSLLSGAVAIHFDADGAVGSSLDDFTEADPALWIADSKVSVFFVPADGGATVSAEFKVDGATISNGGRSAELINVTDLSGLNGVYTVYAFTPYAASNSLNSTDLNLSSQTQPAGHTDYSHLSNTAYMRASGIDATFANGATSSAVNFEFEQVTSLLRFSITNDSGEPINVTGIRLSHAGLFSTVTYDVETGLYVQGPQDSSIDLSFGSGQSLAGGASFNSYFSAFPIPSSPASNDDLILTISYTDGGGVKEKVLSISPMQMMLRSDLYIFYQGSRFLFELAVGS